MKKSKVNENDNEMILWKSKVGEQNFKKFLRFFKNVCKNPAEPKES